MAKDKNNMKTWSVRAHYTAEVVFESEAETYEEVIEKLGGSFVERNKYTFCIAVDYLAQRGVRLVETDVYQDPSPTNQEIACKWEVYEVMGGIDIEEDE